VSLQPALWTLDHTWPVVRFRGFTPLPNYAAWWQRHDGYEQHAQGCDAAVSKLRPFSCKSCQWVVQCRK